MTTSTITVMVTDTIMSHNYCHPHRLYCHHQRYLITIYGSLTMITAVHITISIGLISVRISPF